MVDTWTPGLATPRQFPHKRDVHLDEVRLRGLERATELGKVGGLWRLRPTDLWPDTYTERLAWIKAFRASGFTIGDKPATRPEGGPFILYRGSPADTRDGLAWTPVAAIAAVYAFGPLHWNLNRRAGVLWAAAVPRSALLAAWKSHAPVIGDWTELVVDTRAAVIRRADPDLENTCRRFVGSYLRGPLADAVWTAFGGALDEAAR